MDVGSDSQQILCNSFEDNCSIGSIDNTIVNDVESVSNMNSKPLSSDEVVPTGHSKSENVDEDVKESRDVESISEKSEEKDEATVLETFDITPDKSSGVMKQIIQPGDGEDYPGHGDRVMVHYTGWLLNNKEKPVLFDSSRKRDKCEFTLGKGMVIKGWDLGIATMMKGEVALFIIQPQYAYGSIGSPPVIPPHTTLLFEVELFGWKLEDLTPKKDGGVLRKVLYKGDEPNSPNEGALVKVKLVGYFEERVFDDREVEFVLGEGCNANIPEGIEIALLKFRLSEKSLLFILSKYACDAVGSPVDNKLTEGSLKYEVTLLKIVKAKDVWEMNSDEKLEASILAREKGLSYFKVANYKVALKQFKLIITYLENEPGVSLDDRESREALLLTGYLNIALCNLKLNNFFDTIKACDKALEKDPENEKALFRRGQAKLSISDCEEALEDFEKLCLSNPDNKAAKKYVIICQERAKQQKLKDKGTYNKMFEKFVKQDEEKLRNMKTETGTWDEEARKAKDLITIDSRQLLDSNDSLLSNVKLIQLTGI